MRILNWLFPSKVEEIKEETVKERPDWLKEQLLRDKREDDLENTRCNNNYRGLIKRLAQEKYDFLLYSNDMMFIPRMPGVVTIGTNHKEVFPQKLDFYVQEELDKLMSKHTEEEIKQFKKDKLIRSMGIEMYNLIYEQNE